MMPSLLPLKYFISRKWGGLLKVLLGVTIVYATFMMMTYLSYGNTESAVSITKMLRNATVIPYTDDITINDNSMQSRKRPPDTRNSIIVPVPIKTGDFIPNCGLSLPCKDNEFAIHIYTGKDHNDHPQLCVDGKYIFAKEVNGAGRGINVAVVDNITQTVVRVSHFDTYERDSTALETLLLTLRPGDIVILLTFDEPTRKLSRVAKLLFHELGSAMIQNLYYRGSWYMVSQKGISGFTPYEELHLVEAGGWSPPHDARFCVPLKMEGQSIHPDPLPRENKARQDFCNVNADFPHFCDVDVVNDPLFPAPAIKQPVVSNKIYSVPILVLSGENIQYLPLTLETIIRQGGVNPSLVVVYYLSQHQEVAKMVDLFGFMSEEFEAISYCDQISEALETAELLFPDASQIILIEEGAFLSPDFLSYMGQLLPLMSMDSTIASISAWNDNGFQGVSGDPSIVYRVEYFPGIAFMIRKSFFQRSWCRNSTNDWLLNSIEISNESLIPDLSRVLMINVNSTTESQSVYQQTLPIEKRMISMEDEAVLHKVENLQQLQYEHQVNMHLSTAFHLSFDTSVLANCGDLREQGEEVAYNGLENLVSSVKLNYTGQPIVLYYQQTDRMDLEMLKLLCRCLGLYYNAHQSPRGLHNGMLRFVWKGSHVFLIGSASPYYNVKGTETLQF